MLRKRKKRAMTYIVYNTLSVKKYRVLDRETRDAFEQHATDYYCEHYCNETFLRAFAKIARKRNNFKLAATCEAEILIAQRKQAFWERNYYFDAAAATQQCAKLNSIDYTKRIEMRLTTM